MTGPMWTRPARAGLLVLAALSAVPLLLTGCGGTTATPTTVAPTVAAAATKAAPTVAAAAPTVAGAATKAAPTVSAGATTVAPTVAAVAPTVAAVAPTVAAAATGVAGTTAGQLSDSGRTVYATSCASCHGAQGEGVSAPPVIGANIRFPSRFGTAQELFAYISTAMPANSPGSLSAQQYLQVTSFILVQNNFVQPNAPLVSTALSAVPLKR